MIVTLSSTSDLVIPRRAISSAEIDGVEFGVIGDGVPHGAAAAVFPPFARPALRSNPRRLVVVDAGLARPRPESPELLAGLGVLRLHLPADRSHLPTPIAHSPLPAQP